jgi:hypothetical protein
MLQADNADLRILKKRAAVSLSYFLIVALLGAFLRFLFLYPIEGVSYKNFLHAHSHLALLGWLFYGILAVLVYAFIHEENKKYKFRILFFLFNISIAGMLIAFPVQGYALYSIAFSTLHILLSYTFIVFFLKDIAENKLLQKKYRFSLKFIRASFLFFILSSAGPFSLGILMAKGFGGSVLYNLSVYYYLHFFYNGWLTFSLFGLLFYLLESKEVKFNSKQSNFFFHLLFWSCFPAFALSALWTKPPDVVYYIAGLSAAFQIAALAAGAGIYKNCLEKIKNIYSKEAVLFITIALAAFAVKIALQAVSAIPYFAELFYALKNFVIAYLHLVLIGFGAIMLAGIFIALEVISFSRYGWSLFFAGFILSETLLIWQGFSAWTGLSLFDNFYLILFLVSLLMPSGLILILFNAIKDHNNMQNNSV